jgi:hypothetical protein
VNEWVLLAYRLPREPSRPRLALWRALRRLGAAQVADGLAALPLTAETREHFEWLASAAADDQGEASVWIALATTRDQDQGWRDQMSAAVEAEYTDLRERAAAARVHDEPGQVRQRRYLRAELRRIRARDYFNAPGARHAEAAIEALGNEALVNEMKGVPAR